MYIVSDSTILFCYKTADVIDRLKMYSGYPVRSLVENEKVPVDRQELILTDDDLKLIHSECERSLTKIFQIAYKLTRTITGALLKNTNVTIATVSTPVYGFYLLNKQGYNPNLLPLIDTAIEDLFVSQVLMKWFTITRQFDFLKVQQQDYPSLVMGVNNSLTELYKPKVLSTDITPIFTQEVITVDPETDTVTGAVVIVPDVVEPFIDDFPFIFNDIDVDPGQIYPIFLKARYDFLINEITLQSDTGGISVKISINGVPIGGLGLISANTIKNSYTSTSNKQVYGGDSVQLEIISLTDSPTQLYGNLLIQRT